MLRDLSTRDSTILKGLAICAIVLHNFFHFVSPARENEFTFDPARFHVFLQTVQDPALSVQAFFSFFGHFGVQIFVFLSAFGLAKSHWEDTDSWARFMWGRIKKLYPLFGLVVLPWVIASAVVRGPLHFVHEYGLHLVLMGLGVSTLVGYGLPPVGPWWFIPFIVQFYAVWPLLRYLARRFGWPALVGVAIAGVAVTWILNPVLDRWSVNLMMTPIGRLPVLCFGILAARYPVRITFPIAVAGLSLLLLGSEYRVLWLLTPLAASLVLLWSYLQLRKRLIESNLLVRLGEYSLFVFLVNAIIRDEFVTFTTGPATQILWGILDALASFAIAAVIYEWMRPRRKRSVAVPEAVEVSS